MAKANVRRQDKGDGADFVNERRAADEAVNERLKSQAGNDKLDPRTANNKNKAAYHPEDSTKKSGRSKE